MRASLGGAALLLSTLWGCTCLDLTTARAYPCAPEGAGQQCPEGWRCGLEGQCHELGVAAAYACESDLDCEADWRCGPGEARQCLDPAREALRPAGVPLVDLFDAPGLFPPGAVGAVEPTLGWFDVEGGCRTLHPDGMAFLHDGGVHKALFYRGNGLELTDAGELPTPEECGDGGLRAHPVSVASASLGAHVGIDVVDLERQTHVLAEGGTLCTFELTSPLTLDGACVEGALGFEARRLRIHEDLSQPLIVALSETEYALIDARTGTVGPKGRIALPDGGSARLNDLLAMTGATPAFLQAATPEGVFARGLDGTRVSDGGVLGPDEWEPMYLPGVRHPAVTWYDPGEPIGFRHAGESWGAGGILGLHRREWEADGGFSDSLTFHIAELDDGGFPAWEGPRLPAPTSNVYQRVVYANLSLDNCWETCGQNRALEGYHFAWEQTSYEIEEPILKVELRCAAAGGGAGGTPALSFDRWCYFPKNATMPDNPRFRRPVVSSRTGDRSWAQADDQGRLWATEWEFAPRPRVLDRAPQTLGRFAGQLFAFAGPVLYSADIARDHVVSEAQGFGHWPGLGFLEGGMDLFAFAEVPGEPGWILIGEESTQTYVLVEMLEDFSGDAFFRILARFPEGEFFGPPFRASRMVNAAGRTVVAIASYDALLAADITEQLTLPPAEEFTLEYFYSAPKLEVKLVPMNRTPILSVTGLAAAPGGEGAAPYAEGYLLQAGRIFHFTAPNPTVWRSEELLIDQAEPIQVFADRERGRAGARSGEVWSLPGRVQLAPPLPPEAGDSASFAQVCAELFVQTRSARLFRLIVQEGAAMGEWEELPLGSAWEGERAGRLFVERGRLYAFSASGKSFELSVPGCG